MAPMVDPAHSPVSSSSREARTDPEAAPVDPADFPGCRAIHIPRSEIEDYEGRLEYWEARTETAMVVCEATTRFHEQPSHQLAGLTRLIAASRGSLIQAYGTTALGKFDDQGRFKAFMQADQILYLHPSPPEELTPRVDVDRDDLPDVILEVDYSTDVRVRKLPLYEAWGFPEVWVDVPDARYPRRPRSRLSGLTIHLLEDGRFREARSSRAFPGWTAEEIHRALNEHSTSGSTAAALHRVGAALGATEGTGPDDDSWSRRHRDEGRNEGRVQGLEQGRVQGLEQGRMQGLEQGLEQGRVQGRMQGLEQGRAEARANTVAALLEERGILTSMAFPARLGELGQIPEPDLIRAALKCASETEFLELCARRRRS